MLAILAIIVVLTFINAIYVAAEFATVAVKSVRIQALAESGHKTAQRLAPHLADATSLDRYVAACQIGITASTLLLGAFAQSRLVHLVEPWLTRVTGLDPTQAASVTATTILILITAFNVVLGELLPKAVALRFPERVALALTYPMLVSLWLYHWFIKVLNGTGTLILKAMRVPVVGHRHVHSPEELEQLVSHGADSVTLDETERRLMSRVFRFGDHTAQNIMVPRMKVQGLFLSTALDEALETMQTSGHTRFPVFDGEADKVEGYIHIMDVTRALADGALTDLSTLLRPVAYAPANLAVDRLFERMRKERAHLVVLLDEFGGTMGIVTMEDILGEVLGEMQDEFGRRDGRILERDEKGLTVRGVMLLDQLQEETSWPMEPSPADTVGGLVMHVLGRPAVEGDEVVFSGVKFMVRQVQGHRVARVRVERA
jgi:putative hemolysin